VKRLRAMLALSALSAAAICAGPRAGGAAGPLSLGRGGTCRARRARMASVSGSVYPASEVRALPSAALSVAPSSPRPQPGHPPVSPPQPGSPAVQLFTKEGCTLCDKVKEVLVSVAAEQPHSLEAVSAAPLHIVWVIRG
jgi:hypothetical protein